MERAGLLWRIMPNSKRVDIRKMSFTVKVIRHRNRLPRDMVDAPLLDTFKARLDQALSNLI